MIGKRSLLGAVLVLAGAGASGAATLPSGWVSEGSGGGIGADGVVGTVPGSDSHYYVSTDGGVSGTGSLEGIGGPGEPLQGSLVTTDVFSAEAGDELSFLFNYVTSDGAGYADYAWSRLLSENGDEVALLFTARTTVGGSSVPGLGMPDPAATLTPSDVAVQQGTTWSVLGFSSGFCYANGCGNTGWIESLFTIAEGGNYRLQFGVTDWNDNAFASGLAFSDYTVTGTTDPTPPPVPLPAAAWLLLGGLVALRLQARPRG